MTAFSGVDCFAFFAKGCVDTSASTGAARFTGVALGELRVWGEERRWGAAVSFFVSSAATSTAPGGLSLVTPDASPFFDPVFAPLVNAFLNSSTRSASAAFRATAAASRAASFCSFFVGWRAFTSRGGFGAFAGGASRGFTSPSNSFSNLLFTVSRPGIITREVSTGVFPPAEGTDSFSSDCLPSSSASVFFSALSTSGAGSAPSSENSNPSSSRIFSNCLSNTSADHGENPCRKDPVSNALSASWDHQ